MRTTTTVRVSKELHAWLKYNAQVEDLTINQYLDLKLRDVQPKRGRGKKRVSIPVFVTTSADSPSYLESRYEEEKYLGVPNFAERVD